MPVRDTALARREQSTAVRIPADVDRPDRVLANLTARQVAILSAVGALLYAVYAATRPVLPPAGFLAVALPIAIAAAALVLGARDGLSLDRLLVAAIRQRTAPRLQMGSLGDTQRVPGWLAARALTPSGDPWRSRMPAAGALSLPARAVDGEPGQIGVVDLGPDGLAVVCACSTVNFALRTAAEQESLVAAFGRYLHSLSAPVQLVVRAHRLDLAAQVAELREAARGLPHPELEAAAREHADYLEQLAGHADLLRRQLLLVLRESTGGAQSGESASPGALLLRLFSGSRTRKTDVHDGSFHAAHTRLGRRVSDAARLPAPLGVAVTPLDAAQATAVLASACDPDSLASPPGAFASADDVVTLVAEIDPEPHDPTSTAQDYDPRWAR